MRFFLLSAFNVAGAAATADYDTKFKLTTRPFLPANQVTRGFKVRGNGDWDSSFNNETNSGRGAWEPTGVNLGAQNPSGSDGTLEEHLTDVLYILPPPEEPELASYRVYASSNLTGLTDTERCAAETSVIDNGGAACTAATSRTQSCLGELDYDTTADCPVYVAHGIEDYPRSGKQEIWPSCMAGGFHHAGSGASGYIDEDGAEQPFTAILCQNTPDPVEWAAAGTGGGSGGPTKAGSGEFEAAHVTSECGYNQATCEDARTMERGYHEWSNSAANSDKFVILFPGAGHLEFMKVSGDPDYYPSPFEDDFTSQVANGVAGYTDWEGNDGVRGEIVTGGGCTSIGSEPTYGPCFQRMWGEEATSACGPHCAYVPGGCGTWNNTVDSTQTVGASDGVHDMSAYNANAILSWGIFDSQGLPYLLRFTPEALSIAITGVDTTENELVVCPAYYTGANYGQFTSSHSNDEHADGNARDSTADTPGDGLATSGDDPVFNAHDAAATPAKETIWSLCSPVPWKDSANADTHDDGTTDSEETNSADDQCANPNQIACKQPEIWSSFNYYLVDQELSGMTATGRSTTNTTRAHLYGEDGYAPSFITDESCDDGHESLAYVKSGRLHTVQRNSDCGIREDWHDYDNFQPHQMQYSLVICPDYDTDNNGGNSTTSSCEIKPRCVSCSCSMKLDTDVTFGPVTAWYVEFSEAQMVTDQQTPLTAELHMYTDSTYTYKYDSDYTLPKDTQKYYLQAKVTMTSVVAQISDCQGYGEDNVQVLNLLVDYCAHPKFGYTRDKNTAEDLDNTDKISFHKFRFQGEATVNMKCRVRICANDGSDEICGTCALPANPSDWDASDRRYQVNWGHARNAAPTASFKLAEDDEAPTAGQLQGEVSAGIDDPTFQAMVREQQKQKAKKSGDTTEEEDDEMLIYVLIGGIAIAAILTLMIVRKLAFSTAEKEVDPKETERISAEKTSSGGPTQGNGKSYATKVNMGDVL